MKKHKNELIFELTVDRADLPEEKMPAWRLGVKTLFEYLEAAERRCHELESVEKNIEASAVEGRHPLHLQHLAVRQAQGRRAWMKRTAPAAAALARGQSGTTQRSAEGSHPS